MSAWEDRLEAMVAPRQATWDLSPKCLRVGYISDVERVFLTRLRPKGRDWPGGDS